MQKIYQFVFFFGLLTVLPFVLTVLEDLFPLDLDYYDRSKASTSIQEVVLPFVLIGLADINKAKSIAGNIIKEVVFTVL